MTILKIRMIVQNQRKASWESPCSCQSDVMMVTLHSDSDSAVGHHKSLTEWGPHGHLAYFSVNIKIQGTGEIFKVQSHKCSNVDILHRRNLDGTRCLSLVKNMKPLTWQSWLEKWLSDVWRPGVPGPLRLLQWGENIILQIPPTWRTLLRPGSFHAASPGQWEAGAVWRQPIRGPQLPARVHLGRVRIQGGGGGRARGLQQQAPLHSLRGVTKSRWRLIFNF